MFWVSEQIFLACRTNACLKISWSEGKRVQPFIFEEMLVMCQSYDLALTALFP